MPDDPNPSSLQRDLTRFIQWMSRHLVTLVGTYDPMDGHGNITASEHLYCFPGFVIELLGQWYWATAGHNFNDFFGEFTSKGYVRVRNYLRCCRFDGQVNPYDPQVERRSNCLGVR